MPKILATFAVLITAAFFTLPAPANAAQSRGGAETDQSATMATDISSHRRRYRHRHHWHGHYGPYWGPRPYYGYGYYRPYPYRYHHWGPTIFPFGPWW